tara:strand:+ start:140 stop:991 length:852 start_codon:yes stop_codon:yes gene_type:complete
MYYYKLKKKSIICIEGKDSTSFLQGIITNNTNKIKTNRVIYSTLLSPQGKLLHDFFLFTDMGKIYLDAPKHNINKLKEKLNLYKLNRDITIKEEKIYSYFIFFGKSTNKNLGLSKKLGELKKVNSSKFFNDPRNINLGSRIICYEKKDEDKLIKIIKNKEIKLNSQEYEKRRILNCIPDIEKDNLYNKAYLLQYNFQNLNSICWKKGCFIGQEVTIKMKNRGFVKKKLYVVKSLTKELDSPKEIKFKNELIGETTSHYKNIALAMVKIDKIKNIKKEKNTLII